jgi:hypothetical protein
MNFNSFNLNNNIESGIRNIGYTVPTPIQTQVIPLVLQKKDVMGQAQTGTGKTAVTRPDRAFVWTIENALGEKLERRILENFDYTIPAPKAAESSGRPRRPRKRTGATHTSKETPSRHAGASSAISRSASAMRSGRKNLSNFPFIVGSSQSKSHRPLRTR